jgi:hypothetical protein
MSNYVEVAVYMELTHIHIVYCSNYNGVLLYSKDEMDIGYPIATDYNNDMEKLQELIIEKAVDDCDEYGRFNGSLKKLEKFAARCAKMLFGKELTVSFEEDAWST